MARQTSFLLIPSPSFLEEPWIDSFDSLIATVDVELFSAVTDRNLFITGGGIFTFDSVANTLTWTEPIKLTNFVTGFFQEIPAQTITILPGQFFACIQVRGLENITGTITLSNFVEEKLLDRPRGELHVDTVILFRFGDTIIFRNGAILLPSIPTPILTSPSVFVRAFVLSIFLQNYFPNQTLIGTPDGTRTDFFICRNSDACLFAVYLDGLRMIPGIDFTQLGCHRLRFLPPPSPGTVFVLDMHESAVVFQGVYQEANIWNGTPEGAIDGVNDTYTICLPHVPGTLRVYLNGMRMKVGADYTVLSPNTFKFVVPPSTGSDILVDYVADRPGVSEFTPFFVFNEVPTQNTSTEFQTANPYIAGTTMLYLNGLRMKLGTDYTEGPGSHKITFAFAPTPGSKVVIDYMKTS
jgi:hypothetical protein